RCRDKVAVRLLQDAVPLAAAEHVQTGDAALRGSQRVVQQLNVVSQHLIDERGTQYLGLVLEFDKTVGVQHHHEGKRKVGGHRAQLQLSHADAVQRESTC